MIGLTDSDSGDLLSPLFNFGGCFHSPTAALKWQQVLGSDQQCIEHVWDNLSPAEEEKDSSKNSCKYSGENGKDDDESVLLLTVHP